MAEIYQVYKAKVLLWTHSTLQPADILLYTDKKFDKCENFIRTEYPKFEYDKKDQKYKHHNIAKQIDEGYYEYIYIKTSETMKMEKEFKVERLTNHKGDSNLAVIVDQAIPDIYIGTILIVPYAQGFKDPTRVLLQVDENGSPKRMNDKFAIVSEYIYD